MEVRSKKVKTRSSPRLKKGLVEIYTGNGKGKTTAALGLALRALGAGLKVCVIQFLKGAKRYGEHKIAEKLGRLWSPTRPTRFKIIQTGRGCIFAKSKKDVDCKECYKRYSYLPCHIDPQNPQEVDYRLAQDALNLSKKVINSGKYDLVILDEISLALKYKLINLKEVIKMIKEKPKNIELILTGRGMPKEIIAIADLVSEVREVKHPFSRGISARQGIEY